MVARSQIDDLVEVSIRLPRNMLVSSVLSAGTSEVTDEDRLSHAKAILDSRRRRNSVFSLVRFGEPEWNMILDLYIAHGQGARIDVSNLCLASGACHSTAIRHVEKLLRDGYAVRENDHNDGRRAFIVISESLRETMNKWLSSEILKQRLA